MLENCRIALKALADGHAYLADHSDMDLDGDTRWAARWLLAAAAIAYANALVDLADLGYIDTALPTSRALYESLGILGAVDDNAEQAILDRWLEDRKVEPKKVRSAAKRQAERIAKEAAERGIKLDVVDSTTREPGLAGDTGLRPEPAGYWECGIKQRLERGDRSPAVLVDRGQGR